MLVRVLTCPLLLTEGAELEEEDADAALFDPEAEDILSMSASRSVRRLPKSTSGQLSSFSSRSVLLCCPAAVTDLVPATAAEVLLLPPAAAAAAAAADCVLLRRRGSQVCSLLHQCFI